LAGEKFVLKIAQIWLSYKPLKNSACIGWIDSVPHECGRAFLCAGEMCYLPSSQVLLHGNPCSLVGHAGEGGSTWSQVQNWDSPS